MRFLCGLLGYVFGNFLTADVVVKKLSGKDVADMGSGNPGMANVWALFGKKAGLAVLLGDLGKTLLACRLAKKRFGKTLGADAVLFAGLGVILGHNYPVWKKFQGGKGVAVTCMWLALVSPVWGILSEIAGGIVTLVTGYLPLGAVVIPSVAALCAFVFAGPVTGICVLVSAILMFLKHGEGLKRIWDGTEEKHFGRKAQRKNS